MIPESLLPIANHLWQSTLFAGAAGLLTLALRKNSARVRHWVWVAASLKFLVPLSLLIAVGSSVHWRRASGPMQTNLSLVLDQVSQPFRAPTSSVSLLSTVPARGSMPPTIFWLAWACGSVGFACSWWVRWRRVRSAVRAGSPIELDLPIRAISSPSFLEPGVFGVLRPVLLLPDGIFEHLTPEQWKAVIAHELCHIRHRDNLIAMIHMFVEAVFWFNLLVWWVGKRMKQERERACDEEVLRLGSEPRTYAQGILKVCELYLESPVACVAGVSGSNLRRRIEEIMNNRIAHKLDFGKKLLLAVAGLLIVAAPTVVGILNAPLIRAQPQAARPTFEVASIKPHDPERRCCTLANAGGGRLTVVGLTVKALVGTAYSVRDFQIFGGPTWVNSDRFDIEAKAEALADMTSERMPLLLQSLLADRFQLKVHTETRELPVYELVAGKNGSKLRAVPAPEPPSPGASDPSPLRPGAFQWRIGDMSGSEVPFDRFVGALSMLLGRPIVNKTGLTGFFDIKLQWTPDTSTADSSGPSLFTAIQEQLGLRLQNAKGPAEAVIIDSAQRPSEN